MEREEEARGDNGPPAAQRRRLVLLDRTQLEASVRSQLGAMFENRCSGSSSASCAPRKSAATALGPLFRHEWFVSRVLPYLSPCEIQNVLGCNQKLQSLLQSTKQVQEAWLSSILTTFSIWDYYARLIFRNETERRKWSNFFAWLDRTTPSRCRVHRALLAEQVVAEEVLEEFPSFFRAVQQPNTTLREEWQQEEEEEEEEEEENEELALPQLRHLTDPMVPFPILHGDFEYWSVAIQKRAQNPTRSEEEEEEEPNVVPYSGLRCYNLLLQAADGHGGFLGVYLESDGTFYHYLDMGDEGEGDGDPTTLEYSSLGHLLCQANYVVVDNDQPCLDHQLCVLAWLVAHRFPPFDAEKGLLQAKNLLVHAREMATLEWIERDDYCGNVSPQTVAFLQDACEGSALFRLAKASEYLQ